VRLTRKNLVILALAVAGLALLAMSVRRAPDQGPARLEEASPSAPHPTSGYAAVDSCSTCHEQIARTYSATGMARAFSKVIASDFKIPARVYHKASDRHYTIVERDGRLYQRRHQIGHGGRETNVFELEAHLAIGSGNHARTLLHRKADGRLVQLPLSWYAERGGYWAMSPGYDKPAHLDFRRVIDAGCMSCHNGYPRAPVEDDLEGPRFGDSLPEGIDCQRCHGPGQAHIEAVKAGDLAASRRAIVNPATLDRARQIETCLQCHLESTSSALPFQVRRYEHPPFSYEPGKPLGDYFIHFDHAPGSGREDKFEIAGGAYRLRQSACFQRSEMTCGTCHDPHDIPRGASAVEHYVARCQSCHQDPHRGAPPQVQGMSTRATCLDCHMPKRRAEDAVHVVMTDHTIQRRQPPRDLLAARTEAEAATYRDYRGEVVPYYPPALPETPANELYVAVAQVQQGSNLTAGLQRLERAIEQHRPERAEFYHELARAHAASGDYAAAIRWAQEALRRNPGFVPALKELSAAATAMGRFPEAAQALEKVVAVRPSDANALADLGNVYLREDRGAQAYAVLQRALALDPGLPRSQNSSGLAALSSGNEAAAESHFREAIRLQPDLAEAQNNLGNLLAGRKAYAEAAHHFEKAVASRPDYVEARHSYGVVLALMQNHAKAAEELASVVRLAPALGAARLDLADVQAAMGRTYEARAHLEVAARSGDAEVRQAALAGLRALGR
jgi:tetratricopeptide (TPR) repeat protein